MIGEWFERIRFWCVMLMKSIQCIGFEALRSALGRRQIGEWFGGIRLDEIQGATPDASGRSLIWRSISLRVCFPRRSHRQQ